MGLFDKKFCDICGEKIGLLGNRKLEDGNLCKDCASKLSPWFSERKSSTVEQIRGQLDYREENREKVAQFRTTRTLGKNTKILLDEDHEKLIITSAKNLETANPDVIDFADVTGCNFDIEESRNEIKRETPDGKEVSYNPPRYEYEYDFYVTVFVNNPYFDQCRFRLNSSSVEIGSNTTTSTTTAARTVTPPPRPGQTASRPVSRPPVPQRTTTTSVTKPNPQLNAEYREYKNMGEEIRRTLTQLRQQARNAAEAAAAPKQAVVCPFCGGTSVPDANGCCQYCGAAVL